MAKERHRWVIYYDETLLMKMNRLREETAKKDNVTVEEVPVSQVVRNLTEEKYVEYADKQNNRSRITDIVNGLAALTNAVATLIEKDPAPRSDIAELKELLAEVRQFVLPEDYRSSDW